ncbi:hypothetical protein [Streptomyces albireticuli]|uniref:hypothetical protein n=1 Tax=Streptomyces albireticuli TaxID=1940 RepID=UPI0036AE4728
MILPSMFVVFDVRGDGVVNAEGRARDALPQDEPPPARTRTRIRTGSEALPVRPTRMPGLSRRASPGAGA